MVLKALSFASWILADLCSPGHPGGASFSFGGHFNLPRCEVDATIVLSVSPDYLNFPILHSKHHFSGLFLGRRLSSSNLKPF